MRRDVRLAIKKRDRLLRNHNRIRTDVSWERNRQQRNYTVSLIRRAKKSYYEKANRDLSVPIVSKKKWWLITKRLCIVDNGIPIVDLKEKATCFNDFFYFSDFTSRLR